MQDIQNDIILAFNEGDEKAFNVIYKFYYRPICYFAEKLTGNASEAEDITIRAFTSLFRLHTNFATQANIKAFLYITTRNACLNFLTSERRKKGHLKALMKLKSEEPLSLELNETLQHEMIEAVMLKQIYAAVEELPVQCQRVFKMYYYEKLKPAQIAERLSISPETVRNHKSRALALLRIKLADNHMALAILCWFSLMEHSSFLQHADLLP